MRRALRAAILTSIFIVGTCVLGPTLAAESPLDLAAYSGRVVYLDFWASWCEPCRKSFPWMQRMKNAYGASGLTVIGIDVDSEPADGERFLAQFKPDFEIRFDRQGLLPEKFQVIGMPTSILIDKHGVARFRHVGFRPVDAPVYEQQIRELLAEH